VSLIISKWGNLSPPLSFYNGTETLRFSEEKWLYLRETPAGLQPLEGVTKTCHIIDRSMALVPWAVRKAMEKLRLALLTQHYGPDGCVYLFLNELDAIIESAKKADSEILEDAANVGKQAHKWCEKLIKAKIAEDESRAAYLIGHLPEDERAANACVAAVDFFARHNLRFLESEKRVYSRSQGFAGTLDGLVLADSCEDPLCCPNKFVDHLTILDFKTSNHLLLEHTLQLSAYHFGWSEERKFENPDYQHVTDAFIIRMGKEDAEFDPWHLEGEDLFAQFFAAFASALNLVKTLAPCREWVADRLEAKRAVKRAAKQAAREAEMRIACPKSKVYKGVKLTACLPDGSQCEACKKIYDDKHTGM